MSVGESKRTTNSMNNNFTNPADQSWAAMIQKSGRKLQEQTDFELLKVSAEELAGIEVDKLGDEE